MQDKKYRQYAPCYRLMPCSSPQQRFSLICRSLPSCLLLCYQPVCNMSMKFLKSSVPAPKYTCTANVRTSESPHLRRVMSYCRLLILCHFKRTHILCNAKYQASKNLFFRKRTLWRHPLRIWHPSSASCSYCSNQVSRMLTFAPCALSKGIHGHH